MLFKLIGTFIPQGIYCTVCMLTSELHYNDQASFWNNYCCKLIKFHNNEFQLQFIEIKTNTVAQSAISACKDACSHRSGKGLKRKSDVNMHKDYYYVPDEPFLGLGAACSRF